MVKSSGCAGISFEKWKALKGRERMGSGTSFCSGEEEEPSQGMWLAAGLSVAPWSRHGSRESFQAHFSIGGCQLAGAQAFHRRGFDCRVIVAMAPCPAGSPQPHLCCPPVPGPGLSPSPGCCARSFALAEPQGTR